MSFKDLAAKEAAAKGASTGKPKDAPPPKTDKKPAEAPPKS